MSSSVFFKFKSQKEPSRVTFDGTGISVFELKREIISINHLGDGTDFDLAIYKEDTNEEYDDDTTIIPRSTSIIARRLPPAKPGRGGAARYVSGKMPVNARSSGRADTFQSRPAAQGRNPIASTALSEMNGAQTEEERIEAMFKAGADQWAQQQQEMANATPIHRGGPMKGKPVNVPDHKPPPGYICYRCGEKGHWIQMCPTNNDPNYDGRPRVKRTTGIPRSFLKTVEKPAALGNDDNGDEPKHPRGVMVNAEGEYVVAEPDKASWEQYQAKAKVSAAAQQAAASGSEELREKGLECPIDKRMFVDPTRTPCCGKIYCNDCIVNALIENDFVCPGCSTEGVLIDDLIPDDETATKIRAYESEKAIAKAAEKKSPSPVTQAVASTTKDNKDTASAGRPQAMKPPTTAATSGNNKKRPAEEELPPPRASGALAAARSPNPETRPQPSKKAKTNSPLATSAQPQTRPPENAFPNQMPFMANDLMSSQNMNPMAFASSNGYMGMGLTMAPLMATGNAFMDNFMMQPTGYMDMNGGGWNNAGMAGFLQPQNGMYGASYGPSMAANGGYGTAGMQYPMGNGGAMGMAGMGMNNFQHQPMPAAGKGHGNFLNQQRTVFSEPFPNEEDNAYFRKPVNPHRHQARQRRIRPSDYREL